MASFVERIPEVVADAGEAAGVKDRVMQCHACEDAHRCEDGVKIPGPSWARVQDEVLVVSGPLVLAHWSSDLEVYFDVSLCSLHTPMQRRNACFWPRQRR